MNENAVPGYAVGTSVARMGRLADRSRLVGLYYLRDDYDDCLIHIYMHIHIHIHIYNHSVEIAKTVNINISYQSKNSYHLQLGLIPKLKEK